MAADDVRAAPLPVPAHPDTPPDCWCRPTSCSPVAASTTLTLRGGALQIQVGPFADTREKPAGTFVIDVPDLDAELTRAEKCPGAQYGVIEIRPSAINFHDGEWHSTV